MDVAERRDAPRDGPAHGDVADGELAYAFPPRNVVGWPWSAGPGLTRFRDPTGTITSSRLAFM